MFTKIYQILFLNTLITGTLIAITANSWFTSWIGLEMNLLSMIPLMLNKINQNLTEASIKYFLTQAMASLMLLIAINFELYFNQSISMELLEKIATSALLVKAGMAPFHFWFPQVILKMEWLLCFILFTWQKVAPFILIVNLNTTLMILATTLSALVGSLGGLNQNNLKFILTYSSIAHSAWMLQACIINLNIWLIYFIIYFLTNLSLVSFFLKYKSKNLIKSIVLWPTNNLYKMLFFVNFMSLGGLPPLLGFFGKMILIQMLLNYQLIFILTILILSSLISLYFYMRVTYTLFFYKNSTINRLYLPNKINFWMTVPIMLVIFVPLILIM